MAEHYAGIDVGGTNMQIGVVDAAGKLVGRARDKTAPDEGVGAVVARMANGIDLACEAAGITRDRLTGIGVGAPSPIDLTKRIAVNALNLGWINVPLADLVEDAVGHGVPVTLDNDVNVAVWGEYVLGAAKDARHVMGIWAGTGIGGGLVLDGKLFDGATGMASEIGHIVVDAAGAPDSRTLEQHAARSSVERAVRHGLNTNMPSCVLQLADTSNPDDVFIHHIIEAARDHQDPLCLDAVSHAAEMIGIASGNMVTMLSLDCIVLGGGLTEVGGDWFLHLVQKAYDHWVFGPFRETCVIKTTELCDNAGLLGAAMLARKRRAHA